MLSKKIQLDIFMGAVSKVFKELIKECIKATLNTREFKIELDHLIAKLPISWRHRLRRWKCFLSSRGHNWEIHEPGKCLMCSKCYWHLFLSPPEINKVGGSGFRTCFHFSMKNYVT